MIGGAPNANPNEEKNVEDKEKEWHYILAANLSTSYTIYPKDLGLSDPKMVVYNYFQTLSSSNVQQFTSSHPLVISPADTTATTATADTTPSTPPTISFSYYIVCPLFGNNWAFLGESNKFITVSHQRIQSMQSTSNGVTIVASGASNEKLKFNFYTPNQQVISSPPCSVDARSGTATINCSKNNSSYSCNCGN